MRDFLPPDARRQAELSRALLESFGLFGYELVTLPVFEYEDVLERGLGALDAGEVLRFVEPETGEVVALRPDMTPQLARVVATRLRDAPPPIRLSYQGSVLRRRKERARRHRQIFQAGIELMGLTGPTGDLEAIEVATTSARRAGLAEFVLDLGHARIAGALLDAVPREHQLPIVEALHQKDTPELRRAAERAALPSKARAAIVELARLHGEPGIVGEALSVLAGTAAEPGARELAEVLASVQARGLAQQVVVDFGETRNFAYYTGTTFQLHAQGPGQAVASGGRYDGLLANFGLPLPAFGFAFGLDDLAWALGEQLPPGGVAIRALLTPDAAGFAAELRARGVPCAVGPGEEALAYARAWRYTHTVSRAAEHAVVGTVLTQAEQLVPLDAAEIARVVCSK